MSQMLFLSSLAIFHAVPIKNLKFSMFKNVFLKCLHILYEVSEFAEMQLCVIEYSFHWFICALEFDY